MPALKSKPKTGLGQKLKGVKKQEQGPLWKGPEDDGPLGGVTQSMLNNFLGCRHRHYVKYILGLQPVSGFSRVLEFGSMWHLAEEAHAKEPAGTKASNRWQGELTIYAQGLCKKYPLAQDEINKWYLVILTTFPLYMDWWSRHKDVIQRTPLLQEETFHVPYTLPSGRIVWLKGMFDSVDLIGKGKDAGIWLKENKTKSEIDEARLGRQLKFDLQTCLYLCALEAAGYDDSKGTWTGGLNKLTSGKRIPIKGVIYNVVRRPLSGGRGSITQREGSDGSVCGGCEGKGERTMYAGTKRETFEMPCARCEGIGMTRAKPPETAEEFQERLRGIIESAVGQEWGMPDGQHFFFQRWTVAITPTDVERFKTRFLSPLLEELCDWYEWVTGGDPWRDGNKLHHQLPFGMYNSLVENGFSDLDEFLMDGNDAGLVRKTTLFEELA